MPHSQRRVNTAPTWRRGLVRQIILAPTVLALVAVFGSAPISVAAAAPAPAAPAADPAVPRVGSVTNALLGWGGISVGADFAIGAPAPEPIAGSLPFGSHIDAIAAASGAGCLVTSGVPYCWGRPSMRGAAGSVGVGGPTAVDTTGALHGLITTSVAVGSDHVCVIAGNQVFCWGANNRGQLGTGTSSTTSDTPVAVDMTELSGHHLSNLVAGQSHTCLLADGAPYCWGANQSGQLGNGSEIDASAPVAVDVSGALAGLPVTTLSAGSNFTCSLAAGWEYCWGNTPQQYSETENWDTPAASFRPAGLVGRSLVAISSGQAVDCALSNDNRLFCRGATGGGYALGSYFNDSQTTEFIPVPVDSALAGKTIGGLSVGDGHACVVASGQAVCWGNNDSGELGLGILSAGSIPVAPYGQGAMAGRTVTTVVAAGDSTYALTAQPLGLVAAPGAFQAINPTRVADTRSGLDVARAAVPAGHSLRIPVTHRAGIPATVGSVLVNIMAVTPAGGGYLVAYPTGTAVPGTSLFNFSPGVSASNMTFLPPGRDGSITVINRSSAAVHLVVDASGYTIAGSPTTPGSFRPVPGTRAFDTRKVHTPVAARGTYTWTAAGAAGIPPTGAVAVLIDVTAVNAKAAGAITSGPDKSATNVAADLDFPAAAAASNVAVIKIGTDGKIQFTNGSRGSVDLLVDVLGYFVAGIPTAAGAYVALGSTDLDFGTFDKPLVIWTPRARKVVPDPTLSFGAAHRSPFPSEGCQGAWGNLIVQQPSAAGYLAVQAPTAVVSTSVVNFRSGQSTIHGFVGRTGDVVANASAGTVVVGAEADGCFRL